MCQSLASSQKLAKLLLVMLLRQKLSVEFEIKWKNERENEILLSAALLAKIALASISTAELHLETLSEWHGQSYLLRVFIRSRSTTSSCTYRAFYPNKSARARARKRQWGGDAIIKTNIPFRAGLLFDVPDGAASRLSPREKRNGASSFQACMTVHADPR